jgi:hypothetical protein
MFARTLTTLAVAAMTWLPFGSHAGAVTRPRVHVTPAQMRAWAWVGHCETHDRWHRMTATYFGALGITRVNWVKYGGLRFGATAKQTTRQEQVVIAMRIQRGHPVPDQPTGVSCDRGGW